MRKFTWDLIQNQSDEILSSGLYKLKNQPFCDISSVIERGFGNYLISLDKVPSYIGEGKDLIKRLKQQFNPKISTFYKSFEKLTITNIFIKPELFTLKVIIFCDSCIEFNCSGG